MMGQVVFESEVKGSTEFTFDASPFEAGLYFMSIGKLETVKIIIK